MPDWRNYRAIGEPCPECHLPMDICGWREEETGQILCNDCWWAPDVCSCGHDHSRHHPNCDVGLCACGQFSNDFH